ncbi:hypothetical protein [Idiomarina piscisalsi]|nr:hypothetical protein [Idiomarina piscisalsi]
MMAEAPKKAWQWVTVNEFERPAVPTVITVKKWWQHFTHWLSSEHESDEQNEHENAYELNLDTAIKELDSAFSSWLKDKDDNSLRWVIAPPHSGVAEAAQQWAKQNGMSTMKLPDRDTLCQSNDLPSPKFTKTKVWLMPQLAHTFLRQTNGLRWTREFFTKALAGDAGKGLIVCDSWAWAFLEKVWPVPVSDLWTLQGLDDQALEQIGLARGEGRLRALAALSRGNPGIAAAYSDRYHRNSDKAFETPQLPHEASDATAFVCYALLVHKGLTTEQLAQTLPIVSGSQLQVQLQLLQQQSLITKHDDKALSQSWYVTARGYPVVRDFLASRGFWLDKF